MQRHFNTLVFSRFLRLRIADEDVWGQLGQQMRLEEFMSPESRQGIPETWFRMHPVSTFLDFLSWLKQQTEIQLLKHMRWTSVRRGPWVRGRARQKLQALLVSERATARAWELKESFSHFWTCKFLIRAQAFLGYRCFRAIRSRMEPLKKVARILPAHEELILNWFRAKGEISAGTVEDLNNKIRVVTRRSFGFRTYEAMENPLYHTLGRHPGPESGHRFC